ncbi:putative adenylyltransferase/sulfurtransferase MoeZ [Pseudobythopirellula maris]|uniref:Putative adenylyltransferase/sulfurtransferase MoeZ n=1 Tax=Pseudobythopirellula maris TaxID=2527991 RepID=A0A5C5ZWC1_9BACT|nr:rhodanese-like domain-containing protein [Pseudobythopirellula maris]TWT90553.1 putative adenylyltransferase/sulfurtransferase MoeZ [Pseudobythopirellula maris]
MEEAPLEISCEQVRSLLQAGEPITLVDCREPSEHAIVAIDGAVLIPLAEIPSRCGELDAAAAGPLVVYCHHGMRSAQAAVWLRGQGFPAAQSMAGGVDRWALEIEPGIARY